MLHRPPLEIIPEIPSERRHNCFVIEACAMTSEMKKTGSDHARTIDHHTDDLTLSLGKASIDGVGGRARCRIDPDQAEIAGETFDYLRIEGRIRPIIDHDHLVVV